MAASGVVPVVGPTTPSRTSLLLLGGDDSWLFPDPDPDVDPLPEPEPEFGDVVVGLVGLSARAGDAMASAASAAPAMIRCHSRNDRDITRPYFPPLPAASSLSASTFFVASGLAALRSARASVSACLISALAFAVGWSC